jgi:nucleoside-diphosphate-sugar epimerase
MRILVAGGAGYIGSRLVPSLVERGYEVQVVDLLWFGNSLPESFPVIEKDLMELQQRDLEGFDQVIFLAGLSNDPMAEYSPARNFVDNAAGPAYLAYLAKMAGVKRYIHGGSCSVYGYAVDEFYTETSPTVSMYPYGISKLQGEYASLQLHDDSFSVICFRQGTVSGYSPRMRLDLIVNTMFKAALTEGMVTVNNPAIWRPVLSIEDAVAAYLRAVEATEDISGIFNIASGNYTVGEVADYVREAVKKHLDRDTRIRIKHLMDYRNYKVSIEKAEKVLSFKPNHDIEDIVKGLVENLDRFSDFENSRYYNIRVFTELYPEPGPADGRE